MEYRPNEDFLFRASWSESFRAPDMQRSFIDTIEGFTSGIDYYQCWLATGTIENCGSSDEYPLGFGKSNITSIETGNLALRDESGDSYSMGIVWEPVDRLTLTFDV
jgi:outer membrane receptor protein involved in Fe transport